MRESGSERGADAAEAGILQLLKVVFQPGTLAADEDWYRGKPEFSYGSLASDMKAERYRRSNMSDFKEMTKVRNGVTSFDSLFYDCRVLFVTDVTTLFTHVAYLLLRRIRRSPSKGSRSSA